MFEIFLQSRDFLLFTLDVLQQLFDVFFALLNFVRFLVEHLHESSDELAERQVVYVRQLMSAVAVGLADR